MTMGLKIHRMIKEDNKDPPELTAEASKRKEVSDGILEIIYNKIMHREKTKRTSSVYLKEDEEDL